MSLSSSFSTSSYFQVISVNKHHISITQRPTSDLRTTLFSSVALRKLHAGLRNSIMNSNQKVHQNFSLLSNNHLEEDYFNHSWNQSTVQVQDDWFEPVGEENNSYGSALLHLSGKLPLSFSQPFTSNFDSNSSSNASSTLGDSIKRIDEVFSSSHNPFEANFIASPLDDFDPRFDNRGMATFPVTRTAQNASSLFNNLSSLPSTQPMYYPNTLIPVTRTNSLGLHSFQHSNHNYKTNSRNQLPSMYDINNHNNIQTNHNHESYSLPSNCVLPSTQPQKDISLENEANRIHFDPFSTFPPPQPVHAFDPPKTSLDFNSHHDYLNFTPAPPQEPFKPHPYARNDSWESLESQEHEEAGVGYNFSNIFSPLASTIAPFSPKEASIEEEVNTVEVKKGKAKKRGKAIKVDENSSEFIPLFDSYQETVPIFDHTGTSIDIDPSLSTPSFIYNYPSDSWICYRRNHLTFDASITLPFSTLDNSLHLNLKSGESCLSSTVTRFELELETFSPRSSITSSSIQLVQLNKHRKITKTSPVEPLVFNVPHKNPYVVQKQKKRNQPESSETIIKNSLTRVQFKKATLNNRSKDLDYFNLLGKLFVFVLEEEEDERGIVREKERRVEIGSWKSGRIVVRGRSPKDFEKQDLVQNNSEEEEEYEDEGRGKGMKRGRASTSTSSKRSGGNGKKLKKE